jgi:hypothetical protein
MKYDKGRVEFTCDDVLLERGFYWAKATALSYVREGDPVGDWYEAALPGRDAFCMRDVAHHATGGQVLGLQPHNLNMLRKFAQNISEGKDFCSYWEIDKDDRPAPIDYTDDKDFWYNLPANFDVLDACWRMYLWTDEPDYIHSADFNRFYDLTVQDYVATWDRNGDGIPDRLAPGTRRGIPSYDEGPGLEDARMLSDLVALQATGYEAYASIHGAKYNRDRTRRFNALASSMREHFERTWWDENQGRYFNVLFNDGSYGYSEGSDPGHLPLHYRLIRSPDRIARHLDILGGLEPQVENMAYMPEVFYAYRRKQKAYEYLLKLTDPVLPRREYPEVGFTVVGAIASGLMGIEPRADRHQVCTLAQLPDGCANASMDHVPVFGGEVRVAHGVGTTRFTNLTGQPLVWSAGFLDCHGRILVDGRDVPVRTEIQWDGSLVSYCDVRVENGYKAIAEVSE